MQETRKQAIKRLVREAKARDLNDDPAPTTRAPTRRERERQIERDAILNRPEPASKGRIDGIEV
jgi:hypothetical protein